MELRSGVVKGNPQPHWLTSIRVCEYPERRY